MPPKDPGGRVILFPFFFCLIKVLRMENTSALFIQGKHCWGTVSSKEYCSGEQTYGVTGSTMAPALLSLCPISPVCRLLTSSLICRRFYHRLSCLSTGSTIDSCRWACTTQRSTTTWRSVHSTLSSMTCACAASSELSTCPLTRQLGTSGTTWVTCC